MTDLALSDASRRTQPELPSKGSERKTHFLIATDSSIRASAPVPAGLLEQMIEDALEIAEEKVVILKGDKVVMLGQAVNILDIARRKGAKGISIATQQPGPGG